MKYISYFGFLLMMISCSSTTPQRTQSYSGAAEDSYTQLLSKEPAIYPPKLEIYSISGWCDADLDINEAGTVENLKNVDCWPLGLFEKSAIASFSQYLYKPAKKNGLSIKSSVHEHIIFSPYSSSDLENKFQERNLFSVIRQLPRLIEMQISDLKKLGDVSGNMDNTPAFKVIPHYPQLALDSRIEGYCIVQFDITPKGYTSNVNAIDCQPSNVFAEPSKIAAHQFVYLPTLKEWSPIATSGKKIKISFKIDFKDNFDEE